jgi:simple sugar transport system permease protein
MMAGAVMSSWVALYAPIEQPELRVLAGISAGALGGVGWALLVGVLKTRFGVNEIFGGVALNAIINTLSIYLISGPWQPPEGGSAQATPPFPQAARLPALSPEFPVPALTLVLAVLAVVGVIVALRGTRFGLELRAAGKNPRSALLLGVPVTRVALLALVICGALAGIAGAHRTLYTYNSLRPLVSGGIGFYALLIALLVGFRAMPVPWVALALAAVVAGSTRVSVLLQLDQTLVGVFQGFLVLLMLMASGIPGLKPAPDAPPAPMDNHTPLEDDRT